jgi:Nitrile hydratase beta subunit
MSTPDRKTELRDPPIPPHPDGAQRAIHDIGGLDFGAIDRSEHDLALWEKRVDAMMILLYTKKGCFKVDAMRRVIEDYGQQAYDATTYYEKWVRAMRNLLVEQEVLSKVEIERRMSEIAAAETASGRDVRTDTIAW